LNNKGQFSIIAALFVAVILIATVIITYSTIRNSPIQDQPQVLSAIDETNLALKQILGFTVGYYGSVLQVTGNSSYAKMLAINYLHSGLVNIANMHPEWGTSFNVRSSDMRAYWFTNTSYSMGNLAVNYSLTGLGMHGITYETSCKLAVQVENTTSNNQTQLILTRDENEPLINLGKQNFKFYRYGYVSSTWELISPSTELVAFANGTYLIDIPHGVDPYSYVIQVEDPRGIIVVASSFSRYTCTLNWNSTLYSTLQDATVVVELLQNSTMRWLGQNLQLTTQAKPIPPIPVKAIHVNQTINGVDQEVPFQIEDWASDYKIPLGLTNNASVFNSRTMLVFLVNPKVSKVTIWWNGSDTATQMPYAYTNKYFTSNISQRTLSNGILNLKIDFSSQDGVNSFKVISTMNTSTATAVFMRINNKVAHYGHSEPMYAVLNGTVRAVLHHEVEWSGGISNCPNVYAHIVLTLPANATYYTYQLRLMFVESQQKRNITDLCPIKLTASTDQPQTENGTLNGYPIVSNATDLFYNFSASYWEHHWSQIISGTKGTGIMFRDSANQMLYFFDSVAGNKTGALRVNSTSKTIELLPVARAPANFTYALDITWYGAVVTFDGTTPIYKEESGKGTGLWIIVEYPPSIAVTTES
jgi:hypothetical protein